MGNIALLVCDIQRGIVNRVPSDTSGYLSRLSDTIKVARDAGIQVIYVTASFRPGYPDISRRNMFAATVPAMGSNIFTEGDSSVEIHPEVSPVKGDIIVTKRRICAFTGTDLEIVLRSLDVVDLAICGIMTSGVVLSTVRHGADLDYRLTVLEDLCIDGDPEVQDVLMKKVFPRQAQVVSSKAWVAGINN